MMNLFKKKDEWCCSLFRDYYGEAGRGTGFGLLISTSSEGLPVFKMQHRAVDKNPQEIKLPIGTRLALLSEVGILYCPWCGRDLRRHYRDSAAKLSRPELESPKY